VIAPTRAPRPLKILKPQKNRTRPESTRRLETDALDLDGNLAERSERSSPEELDAFEPGALERPNEKTDDNDGKEVGISRRKANLH
jgi:hypothetical protein